MAGRPKGLPKTGGRKKGVSNKKTRELKEMILGALSDVGGQEYLARRAKKNPTAFLTLIGKVLPTDMKSSDGSMTPKLIVTLEPRDANA